MYLPLYNTATAAFYLRCLLTSNIRTADATAAFSDSTCPAIGIRIQVSAQSATSCRSPLPSFPIRNAQPPA